jgi:predicted dehydrogenase
VTRYKLQVESCKFTDRTFDPQPPTFNPINCALTSPPEATKSSSIAMNDNSVPNPFASDLTRREFMKSSSFAAAMTMLGGIPLIAQNAPGTPAAEGGPTIKCAVIGCNIWGREILNTLARFPKAEVIAACDHYESEAFQERMKEAAPKAQIYTDYKKVLENTEVKAVLIATPTHQHKEIAIAAIKAGKHVYCEAPLAHTMEDAREIARAARDSFRTYFQAGLGLRSDPQRKFLLPFIRSGATGPTIKTRAQWHRKMSWRRSSPNPDREKELNWRLRKEVSTGLIGELGVQQIDAMHWFLSKRPVSVTGFGSIQLWNDGRDVDDTTQAVFQYEDNTSFNYEACLATSFDSDYEILYGTDAAVMMRGNKAWMFKEADAALLGWEVYARKDQFFKETGIALVADASKSGKQGKGDEEGAGDPPHYYAIEAFLENTKIISEAVEDFVATFDPNDTKALREYLASPHIQKSKLPAANWQDGYESTLSAIKANEAVMKKKMIKFEKEWFEV